MHVVKVYLEHKRYGDAVVPKCATFKADTYTEAQEVANDVCKHGFTVNISGIEEQLDDRSLVRAILVMPSNIVHINIVEEIPF